MQVELLAQTEPVVATLFAEFEFGEMVPVPPDTAAHECLTSYLLTWKLILTLVSGASSELRPRFTEFVRREKFLETLVPSLFHLMPKRTFETSLTPEFPSDKEEGALVTLLQEEKVSIKRNMSPVNLLDWLHAGRTKYRIKKICYSLLQ